jgi:cytochrome c oxidase cbb3-type subunit 3
MALSLVACEREQRHFNEPPSASEALNSVALSPLQPGTPTPPNHPPNPYEGNAFAASEGKRLFEWFNCAGCHGHGGGGMGPALMDEQWIYGSEPAQIFATIIEGRPNGMPSFRGRVPTQQVWQLVTYVRSLSGQLPKDVAPGRADHMMMKPSEQSMPRETPQASSPQPPPQ